MRKTLLLTLLITSIFSQEDGKILFTKYGCYGCHGTNAEGSSTYPKLANLPISYIEKKLWEYKEEKVNSNRADIMKPFAKPLTKKEIEALAEFLHNIKNENEEKYYQEFETGSSCGS